MSALSLEYLRVCGLLILPVVFLATLSAPGPEQAPRVQPRNPRTIDLLALAGQDPRIERVARALCIVRGIDPDHVGPPFPQGPLWEFYIPEAMRFLAQLDAALAPGK